VWLILYSLGTIAVARQTMAGWTRGVEWFYRWRPVYLMERI